MGAQFDTGIAEGDTLDKAFTKLVEEKCYYHGHGGYSGTLAEKNEVVELRVPAGFEGERWRDIVEQLTGLVGDYPWRNDEGGELERLKAELGKHFATAEDHALKLDGDKWGPAFAIKVDDRKWWVGGYCSS